MKTGLKWLVGCLVVIILSTAGKVEAYSVDVGAIRLSQFANTGDSSAWVGVYLDSFYDFSNVTMTLETLSHTKTFASTHLGTNPFLPDPIGDLLTPLNDDDSTNIFSILFTGSLASEVFTYDSKQVKAIGTIQSSWQYFDANYDQLSTTPEYLGLGDFASLTVEVEDIQAVPEPTTIILLAAGAIGLIVLRRRS